MSPDSKSIFRKLGSNLKYVLQTVVENRETSMRDFGQNTGINIVIEALNKWKLFQNAGSSKMVFQTITPQFFVIIG